MRDSAASPGYVQPWAGIDWQTPLTPGSTGYGDIYWSLDQAIAEKQHVFIAGNRLAERWAGMHGRRFTLSEAGFGFGINCLVSANQWRRQNPRGSILNYIAFEKAPVHPADLARLYASLRPGDGIEEHWWRSHLKQLLAHYPVPSAGHHLVWLDADICLHLVIGDVNDTLQGLDRQVDAWYLDGFSPARNPDAWRDSLFKQMAQASTAGASFATYSVAGGVRRALAAAGFHVSRMPGYGRKAEMLCGNVSGEWRPRPLQRVEVGIVGAGLAGLHCAHALIRRGQNVTLFDQRDTPLAAASCVPRLAVSPRLAARPDKGSLFSLAAFQYAMHEGEGVASGYCRLATRSRDPSRFDRIARYFDDDFCRFLPAVEAAETTGLTTGHPALWLAGAGWCEPARQFHAIADTCSLHTGTRITRIAADETSTRITSADGSSFEFDALIIAGGALPFAWTAPLQLTPVRGQSIAARLDRNSIDCVIGGPVSIVPGNDGNVIAGSTFDLNDDDDSIRASDTKLLADQLQRLAGCAVTVTANYAGVRCTTRDRMPVAGRLPDWSALGEYCRGSRRRQFDGYLPRLFVCTGFGAHGATHAPLCAEHIARLITGEPDGIDKVWATLLDAARFAKKGDRRISVVSARRV